MASYPYDVGTKVGEHERRLNQINGSLDRIEERLNGVLVKVGIAAGLGGILAAPVIGAVIYLVSQ